MLRSLTAISVIIVLGAVPSRAAFHFSNPKIAGVLHDTTEKHPPSSYTFKVVWTASRPPFLPPGPYKYEFHSETITVDPQGHFEIPAFSQVKGGAWQLEVASNFETTPPAPVYHQDWATPERFATTTLGHSTGSRFAESMQSVYLMSDRAQMAKISLKSGRPLREYLAQMSGFQQIILRVIRKYRNPASGSIRECEQFGTTQHPEDGVYSVDPLVIPATGTREQPPVFSCVIKLTHSYWGETLFEKALENTTEDALAEQLKNLTIDDTGR
jgi:hypothetical protein